MSVLLPDNTGQVSQIMRCARIAGIARPFDPLLLPSPPSLAWGRRAGVEGDAPAQTWSLPRRRCRACVRYTDCPLTPAPLPQRTGGEGRKNGLW
jgi:hypothetical protein